MISIYLSLVDTQSEKDKVEYIYLKYYSIMSYVASKYVSDKDYIADIVHDSMIKIIYNIDKIDIEDEVRSKAFCITIAKHKAIDFVRKKELHNIPLDENFEDFRFSQDVLDVVVNDESYEIILKRDLYFCNKKKDEAFFVIQIFDNTNTSVFVDNEQMLQKKIKIRGKEAWIMYNEFEDCGSLMIPDEKFSIFIVGDLSKKELIKIGENIK